MEKIRPQPPWLVMLSLPLALLVLYFPVVYMILFSFIVQKGSEYHWTLQWYYEVFADAQLQEAAWQSLKLAFATGLGSTFLGLVLAITVSKTAFKGKAALNVLSLVSLLLPELVIGLTLLIWFHALGLDLGFLTTWLAHVAFTISFCFFSLNVRMQEIANSSLEAAADLGAFDGAILRRILLPQMIPALLVSFILAFMLSFDDFLITFFVNGVGMDTLPIKLYSALKTGHSPKVNALASLLIFFTVVSIWLSSKYLKLHKFLKA
jgi:spermidine/putrescine transport system permease protein